MAKSAKRASETPRNRLRTEKATPKKASSPAAKRDGSAASKGTQPDPTARIDVNEPLECGLYVVSTPIGHLDDITLRAVETLKRVDWIACEDTRVTGKLLRHFGISTPTKSYNDHNGAQMRPQIRSELAQGKAIALVSDAGTPLISDPGLKLVQACADDKVPVIPIPGASAVLAGLVTAGLPTDRFMFCGFLPSKTTARQTVLRDLATIPATLVFFETGRRLASTLSDMSTCLGPRSAAIARELTKLYEHVTRGTLQGLAETVSGGSAPKGECVICIGPPDPSPDVLDVDVEEALRAALTTMSVRDAAAFVSAQTGLKRKAVYAKALAVHAARKDDSDG